MFTIEWADGEGLRRISVCGEMNIYSAGELKTRLLAAAPAQGAVELDLRAVAEFDSAGIQLLELLRRAAPTQTLRVAAASDAVTELLELYRLEPQWLGGCSGDAGATGREAGTREGSS